MAPRLRIIALGLLGALVVAGGACAVFVGGLTGEVLTIVLISAGLTGALLFVFLEIGLGEERDRAEEEAQRRKRGRRTLDTRRRPRLPRWPRRPG